MHLQTSPEIKEVVPEMPRWGCHEMALLRIIDYESGGNLTPDQIEKIHWWATHTKSILGPFQGVDKVVGPNCFIRDPDALLAYAMAIQECMKRVCQIGGINTSTGKESFWGVSEKHGKGVDWMILQNKTNLGFHFTLARGHDGEEIYNPDPTVKTFGVVAKIYYQVRL